MMGKGVLALLPMRVVKSALMLLLETVLIPLVWRYVGRFLPAAAHAAAEEETETERPLAQAGRPCPARRGGPVRRARHKTGSLIQRSI
jgi:hypothetical protein